MFKPTSFHASAYGEAGAELPTDQDGYCHLAVIGWLDAGYDLHEATELAQKAKAIIERIERGKE